jgi:amino acid transporter
MRERHEMSKSLKPSWVWALAFGSAIGWGCFVLPVDWMGQAGPGGAIIGFIIGALLMMVIGNSYGYLIKEFPVSGGEFAYAYKSLGRLNAYICGWFLSLGYLSIIALNASALALLFRFTIPGLVEHVHLYSIAGFNIYLPEVIISSLALLVFAFINIKGISVSGKAQFFFSIVLIAGVVALAIFSVGTSMDTIGANIKPLFNSNVGALSSILAIVAIAPWAYVGIDNVPQTAEEFNFPAKKAHSLILWALISSGVIYSLMILATAAPIPWTETVAAGHMWGTGTVVEGVLGPLGLAALIVAVAMGIFTGLNGFYISTSRLLFAMGRAGILPAIFGKLHPKYKTPYFAVMFSCALALIAPWFGRQALLWIVDMSSTGVAIAYGYTCFAAFKLYKWSDKDGGEARFVSPYKKSVSLLGTIISLGFLGLLVIPGAPGFLKTPSWIALLAWMGIGVVFYLYKRKAYNSIPKDQMDYLIFGDILNKQAVKKKVS